MKTILSLLFLLFVISPVRAASTPVASLFTPTHIVWQETESLARPPRRRYYQIYKGLDFSLSAGVNYIYDEYTFRSPTDYQLALENAFEPTVGRAFSAHIETPIGQYFRLGTGLNILSKKRSFTPPPNVEILPGTDDFQLHRTLQIPLYFAFDQRIRHFSVGISLGAALQVYQHTIGARLYEDFRAVQYAETASDPYYDNQLSFRPFTEFRLEYRPTSSLGIIARLGYQLSGGNELATDSRNSRLETRALQLRVGSITRFFAIIVK